MDIQLSQFMFATLSGVTNLSNAVSVSIRRFDGHALEVFKNGTLHVLKLSQEMFGFELDAVARKLVVSVSSLRVSAMWHEASRQMTLFVDPHPPLADPPKAPTSFKQPFRFPVQACVCAWYWPSFRGGAHQCVSHWLKAASRQHQARPPKAHPPPALQDSLRSSC